MPGRDGGNGDRLSEVPAITFGAVVLGAPDARAVGAFYRRLLGWPVTGDEPGWFQLRPPGGGVALSFQDEPDHVPPVWPSQPGAQQMMLQNTRRHPGTGAGHSHGWATVMPAGAPSAIEASRGPACASDTCPVTSSAGRSRPAATRSSIAG